MAQQPQDVDQAAVLAALNEDQPPQQQAAAAADPLVEDNNVSCVIPFGFLPVLIFSSTVISLGRFLPPAAVAGSLGRSYDMKFEFFDIPTVKSALGVSCPPLRLREVRDEFYKPLNQPWALLAPRCG